MEISFAEYKKMNEKFQSNRTTNDELIAIHQNLKGKATHDEYLKIADCGVEVVSTLLSHDWGRTYVYEYGQEANKFFHSAYLSNYFKESIKNLLKEANINDTNIFTILDSNKLINELNEEEISTIITYIKNYQSKEPNIAYHILALLFKLEGKGICSYLKNNIENRNLAEQILLTCGLSERASYYSGRGVGDLDEKNLIAIFNKLLKIDQNYALNFAKMVKEIKCLGATEFITSFLNLAQNNFVYNSLNLEDSNVSLDGVYDKNRDVIGFATILSLMNNHQTEDYQLMISEHIKMNFMQNIKLTLEQLCPDFYQNENYFNKLIYH